jgi:hypothetical protein
MTMLLDPQDQITVNLEPCAKEQIKATSGGFMLLSARPNT